MTKAIAFTLFAVGLSGWLRAEPELLTMVAYDTADHSHYSEGWKPGTGKEISFGEWRMAFAKPNKNSRSGAYLASVDQNNKLSTFSKTNAFALFALGGGGEEAVAQRQFQGKIWEGDVFSFCMNIERLGGGAAEIKGAIGMCISTSEMPPRAGDYNSGAAIEFGAFEGSENYILIDKEGRYDTGVKVGTHPISVSFEFLPNGKYRAQIALLGAKIDDILGVVDSPVRRMSGVDGGERIRSMVFFNRDGGLNDLFFDDIVLERHVSE